ncbi:MAG TPA: flagellar basal body L-ring protein FlgH [Desulfopila sp.]|nr:flagellar basal body L-ring protein FlgH [Desulfopila sp.]
MKRYALLLLLLIISGCSGANYSGVTEIPEPLEEIKDYTNEPRQNGSLWSRRSNSLFSDHKAENIGDIVTVTISEQASATKEATTSTDKSSNWNAGIPNFLGLENSDIIANNNLDLTNLINANVSNSFDGSGRTVRTDNLSASLTTQVVGRYSNGNLKIRGGKEVTVNNEVQIIYITGIIRPVDITSANTIDSEKILNARISYTGKGVIADKQEAGWLGRAVDYVWPF